MINCAHFQQQRCTSCQWLAMPYSQQLAEKYTELRQLLAPFDFQTTWLENIPSPQSACRNKAKMVVSGSVERPILGIIQDNQGIDLSDCPLYPASIQAIFPILKQFIGRAGLVPYNIERKRGELKYILLTQSTHNQAVMVRFVLKSEQKRPLIERELAGLLAQLPRDSVVSLNIQPQHSAVLEGEQEIFLTDKQVLAEYFNGIPLFIRPQGFFQTNPTVASQLYATAQQWIVDLPIERIWDLFCGVGGFGLHCASARQKDQPNVRLTGIEISPSAIASATQSAKQLGLSHVQFASLDSAQFALHDQGDVPDLVIVNPPRRGIGQPLARFLNQLGARYLLYSSCHAASMANDLVYFDNYQLTRVQLFDMFPHTSHYETLILLVKKT